MNELALIENLKKASTEEEMAKAYVDLRNYAVKNRLTLAHFKHYFNDELKMHVKSLFNWEAVERSEPNE